MFRSQGEVTNSCGELGAFEVKMNKKKIIDDKPLHINVAILQYSKLLFLDFMYFIKDHLIDGSFRSCYADTGKFKLFNIVMNLIFRFNGFCFQ